MEILRVTGGNMQGHKKCVSVDQCMGLWLSRFTLSPGTSSSFRPTWRPTATSASLATSSSTISTSFESTKFRTTALRTRGPVPSARYRQGSFWFILETSVHLPLNHDCHIWTAYQLSLTLVVRHQHSLYIHFVVYSLYIVSLKHIRNLC